MTYDLYFYSNQTSDEIINVKSALVCLLIIFIYVMFKRIR